MKNRILAVFSVLMLCLLLAGCTEKQTETFQPALPSLPVTEPLAVDSANQTEAPSTAAAETVFSVDSQENLGESSAEGTTEKVKEPQEQDSTVVELDEIVSENEVIIDVTGSIVIGGN